MRLNNYYNKCLLFLCLNLVLGTYSFGQENKNIDKLLEVSLEDLLNVGMVSASKKKQSIQDAPATGYVVTQEIIKQRGYLHLTDLLEDIPEVEMQYNANPQFRNLVTFRGVSGNEKILLMINGIRVTPATGDYYPLSSNFQLSDALRVEVIIGPASALYGADAFGGIINIITHNQETQTMHGISVQSAGGNFSSTNNNLNIGLKADKLLLNVTWNNYYSGEPNLPESYNVSYDWYTNSFKPDGYVVETPYYGQVFNHDFMKKRAGGSFHGGDYKRDFSIPTYSNYINLNATYDKFSVGFIRHSERHSSALGLDPKYTAYESDQFFRQVSNIFYIRNTYTSFNKKWSIFSTLTFNTYKIDPESNFIGSSTRWQRGFIYGQGQSAKIEEQISYEINTKNFLVGGFSYEHLNSLPQTGLTPSPIDPNIPLANQDVYYIGGAGYHPYEEDEDVGKYDSNKVLNQKIFQLTYNNVGGYLQWQRQGRKVDVTAGVRFDHNSRYGNTVNPRVGLVWSMNKRMKLKLLAGTSYLAPSPQKAYAQSGTFYSSKYDSTSGKTTFYSDLFRVANDSLKPETLYSFETNFNYFITSNLSFSINGYYTLIHDMINFYGFASSGMIDAYPNIVSQKYETSMNEGKAVIYGVVPKINYLIRINKLNLNTWISFHGIKSEYEITRNGVTESSELPFVSKYTFKGGIDGQYSRFYFSLRGIFRDAASSNQTTLYLAPGNDKSYQPENAIITNKKFFYLNANIGYEIKNKGKVRITSFVRCRNVLNNLYYNLTYGSDDAMGISPQDPTRYMVGLTVRL